MLLIFQFPLSNFTIMLFHYDGITDQWNDLPWYNQSIHIVALHQTKWWEHTCVSSATIWSCFFQIALFCSILCMSLHNTVSLWVKYTNGFRVYLIFGMIILSLDFPLWSALLIWELSTHLAGVGQPGCSIENTWAKKVYIHLACALER
jgi:hypothetical protein